ncbi:hypothetical protein, partial [Klebsiella pneumoniae]|uniref:hypothetical protein n=1 Tax=Klebsiella pneumoniae TaxID=573 RepID=UPI003457460E
PTDGIAIAMTDRRILVTEPVPALPAGHYQAIASFDRDGWQGRFDLQVSCKNGTETLAVLEAASPDRLGQVAVQFTLTTAAPPSDVEFHIQTDG